MKFRQGISEERSNGQWAKHTVELEEDDLQASSAEMGIDYTTLSTMDRFNLARLLAAALLYSAMAVDYPLAEPELIEARSRLSEFVKHLRAEQKSDRDE